MERAIRIGSVMRTRGVGQSIEMGLSVVLVVNIQVSTYSVLMSILILSLQDPTHLPQSIKIPVVSMAKPKPRSKQILNGLGV